MPSIDDQETARKYLLGQLTVDQQEKFEERLLSDDEVSGEFDVTREELVDQYLAKELTPTESEWLEQHYLLSPEGKRSQRFALGLREYVSSHPGELKKSAWYERLAAFWNRQALPLRAAAAVAVVAVVVGIVWMSRPTSPRSFATMTLINSSSTRSGNGELPRIRLKEDALRITLILPEPAADVRHRAELVDGSKQIPILEPIGQDARSVTVEIPSRQLVRGHYAVTLSTINSDNSPQRIPGAYQFIVE